MQNTELEIDNSVYSGENEARTFRVHGGNIEEAAKRYGLREKDIIDFSSSVNPLGPSSAALRAAKKALSHIDRHSAAAMTDLHKAIARYFGIKPGQVICGNGSSSLIHLIPAVFKPKKVLIPVPTFSEYAAAVTKAGGEAVHLELPERTGFRIDPLEMAFALKGMDMAFLCNPNNPTGLLMTKPDMLEIAKYALEQGVRLVIDEAFMDFINTETIVKEAVHASHLICLRTFTSFFGMPGLRIGYAVSEEATVSALRAGQEPWAVNTPAERAAVAALTDWRHTRRTRRTIEKERERLLSSIRILPGVETYPSSANFIFMKVTASKAAFLTEKLALRGLLVRDCSSFSGLDNRFIRIAVRTGRENKRLIQALRELLTP